MAVMLLHLLEFANKILAHLMRILYEMLVLHDVEHGESSCASQMVAAERSAEHAIDWFELGRDNHGTHWETIADTLGAGDDVGTNAEPLVGEELATTSVAALYLIADEHRAILLAGCLQTLGKLLIDHTYAANTLYALDDASGNVALGKLALPCLKVVEGQIGHVAAIVDGRNNLGIVGHLNRQRRTTVERFLCRQHTCATGMERSELQSVLVSLSA